MRSSAIIISALVILGAIAAQWLVVDTGYVYVSIYGVAIETSVWMGLLSGFIIIFTLWFIYQLARAGIMLPTQLKKGLAHRKSMRRQIQLKRYLIYLMSGNHNKIYRNAKRAFNDSKSLEAQMIVAEACLKLKKYDELIKICQQVQQATGQEKLSQEDRQEIFKATNLLMARAYYQQGNSHRAIRLLQKYKEDSLDTSHAYDLLLQIYRQDRRWEQLGLLLAKADTTLTRNRRALLDFYDHCPALQALNDQWDSLDKASKRDPELLSNYCLAASRHNDTELPIKLLETELKRNYTTQLVTAYQQIVSAQPIQQLKFLEELRQSQGADEALLVALAHLSVVNRLQTKALEYYAELVKQFPRTAEQNRIAYARLLEESNTSNQQEQAHKIYRGLEGSAPPATETEKSDKGDGAVDNKD